MPLGISERKIEKAYGPLDLSGVYKPLIATAQKIAADESKRVDEAKKQLATTSAELNKLRVGVREKDLSDITRMYNRWAEVERQLANNPNLIRRNPDTYGELKNESNTLYGNMLGLINESKQQSKIELDYMKMLADPNNRNKFKENSLQVFKSNVLEAPVSALKGNPYNDITTYYETLIDGSKFYNELPNVLNTAVLNDYSIYKDDKDDFGQVTKINVKNMPSDSLLKSNIYNKVKGVFGRDTEKFAEQQLTQMIKDGSYDIIKNAYNNFWNNKKNLEYGLPNVTKAIDLDAEPLNYTDAFTNIEAAKEFINRLRPLGPGTREFMTKADEMRYRESIRKVAGDKGEKEQGLFLYDNTVNKLIKSKQKFPGKNFFLNTFEPMLQQIAVEKARFAYPGWNLRAEELSLNYDPERGTIDIYTNRAIKGTAKDGETPDEIPVRKKVASLGRIDLDTEASSEYGVGARRAVLKQQPKEEPTKRNARSTGRKNISGF